MNSSLPAQWIALTRTATVVGVLSILMCGCEPTRYYTLSPLRGVVEIDVITNISEVAGTIVDRKQVEAVISFMNMRLDHWYDPHGSAFGTTGKLRFLDVRHKEIAYVSFGTGGMYQIRPDMTYTDSVKRRTFLVARNPELSQARNDSAILCDLLGRRFYSAVCDVHT